MVVTRAGETARPFPRARPPRTPAVGWLLERLESRTLLSHNAGLAAWFRADTLSLPSGAPVASWADASGHGLSATQPTAARRPTYQPEGLNGRPSVRFSAAATTQLTFARPVAGDFTLVVVFGSADGAGRGTDWYDAAGLVDGEVGGVTNDFGLSLNEDGQVLAGTGGPDTTAASGLGFDDGRAHVAVFTRTASTGATSLHVDGRLFERKTGGTQALTATQRLTMGSLQTNTKYFTGDIGEVRVYATAVGDATRAAIESELVRKYNVAPTPAAWFDNPVIDGNFPDPGVVYANGLYYAFATNGGGRNVQAARSADLVNWTTLPDALPTLPTWARGGRTWAPDVAVTAGGTYALYYTAWNRSTDRQAIGVATSSNPAGPFTPVGSAPLVSQTALGGAIDASVFTAASGTRYLLWKNDGNAVGADTHIYLQQLAPDGLSLVGTPSQLIKQDRAWEGNLVEGPVLWSQDGRYFLFYSANNYGNGAYATGYAVATSLRGPYTKPAEPLLRTEGDVIGPGGPEVVTGPDGNTWMLYHAWENDLSYRSLNADRLEWLAGVPEVRGPQRAIQPVPQRPRVSGRHVFYNNSAFDGVDSAANRADDAAVATDKRAFFPGETPSFANVTSYSRGINGVMIDVTALPAETDALAASSFVVRLSAGGDAWTAGPSPSGVTIRRGQGVNGSDRVTLTWPDGAVRNTWVQVTVPTATTGLALPDAFAFGSLVGETGDSFAGGRARVTAIDVVRTRGALFSAAPVSSRYDFNRDGKTSVVDLAIVRAAQGNALFFPAAPAELPLPLAAANPAPEEELPSLLA